MRAMSCDPSSRPSAFELLARSGSCPPDPLGEYPDTGRCLLAELGRLAYLSVGCKGFPHSTQCGVGVRIVM
jgi:hypothetical protein